MAEITPHDPIHEYSDDCPGCQPAIRDLESNRNLPPDDPMMAAVLKAWKERTTLAERRAYHRAAFQGSTNPDDLRTMVKVMRIMTDAAHGAG